MRIAMVGTGYVGLVSGACFSEVGTEVISVDNDVAKSDGLKAGRIPIFEPGPTGCRPRPAIRQISDRQGLDLERMKAASQATHHGRSEEHLRPAGDGGGRLQLQLGRPAGAVGLVHRWAIP